MLERADRREGEAGFALVEVLIAAGLLIAIAVGLSQVSAASMRGSRAARVRTFAAVLAAQKMEQLRSLRWTRAPGAGLPVSDTSTDVSSEPPTEDGRGLLSSPPGSLDANVPFYVDYLDGAGRWTGRGAVPPANAVYVRRWAIQPLDSDPGDILVLQVIVATTVPGAAHEARLLSVLARRP